MSKPRLQSYGVALLGNISEDRPLVLDIDDWETGFKLRHGRRFAVAWGIRTLLDSSSFYYVRALEALTGLPDARTVSNRFLQVKFGGELIPHARDTDISDPARFNKQAAREAYDLPSDTQLVMFSGTPRPHKGVAELVREVESMNRADVRAVIVGVDESKNLQKLREIGGESLIIRGRQPFEEIPRWLAAADIIVIPQEKSDATRGHLPAKVFDAMEWGNRLLRRW